MSAGAVLFMIELFIPKRAPADQASLIDCDLPRRTEARMKQPAQEIGVHLTVESDSSGTEALLLLPHCLAIETSLSWYRAGGRAASQRIRGQGGWLERRFLRIETRQGFVNKDGGVRDEGVAHGCRRERVTVALADAGQRRLAAE